MIVAMKKKERLIHLFPALLLIPHESSIRSYKVNNLCKYLVAFSLSLTLVK